ncbi:MAG: peptidylprolyl isomerase [Planctomycetota bacterium]
MAVACLAIGSAASAATPTHKVRMYWNFGEIEVELYGADTPRHVANFLRYAADDLYDDTFVHRVQSGSARFVQGGGFTVPDPFLVQNLVTSPLPSYAPIANEFDPLGDLSNTAGSLAAARTGDPDSATNQWFFNVTDNVGFDGGPYTVFGQITTGFDEWFNQVPYLTQLQTLNAAFTGQYEATTPFAYVNSIEAYVPIVLGETVEIPLIAGDFNLDGYVDAADELVWQAGQGDLYGESPPATLNLTADADGDADVDADDRAVWQANLGQGASPTIVAGDYNRDGLVTEADYLWWETLAGSTTALHADGNRDGVVDLADYTIWRDAWPAATSLAVPEPTAGVLLLGLTWSLSRCRR